MVNDAENFEPGEMENHEIRLVAVFGSGEYELGITPIPGGGDGYLVFRRFQTGLGATGWRIVESGDGPIEDAYHEIVRLALMVGEVASLQAGKTVTLPFNPKTLAQLPR